MGEDETSLGYGAPWRRVVRLRQLPDELFLCTFADGPPRDAVLLSPQAAVARMDAWMASGLAEGFSLFEVALLLERPPADSARERHALRDQLGAELRSGRLRLYARRLPPPVAPEPRDEAENPAGPSQPQNVEKKTWVAIRLVDESDPPKPVPFKRYRIELPDFSVREGRLDANGEARVTGIDPGTCQVTFLDHDASEWRPQ